MANLEFQTFALQYSSTGEPSEVVDMVYKTKTFDLKDNEVLIKVLAAPINVADLVTIRGKSLHFSRLSHLIHFCSQANMQSSPLYQRSPATNVWEKYLLSVQTFKNSR